MPATYRHVRQGEDDDDIELLAAGLKQLGATQISAKKIQWLAL